jgi:integrase/recombinase XerD
VTQDTTTPRRKLDADLLSTNEVEALLSCCSRRAPTGLRNRCLIVLAWRCGIRCQEALDLAVKDIDFDNSTITVQRGKAGKRRVVGMDAGTAAVAQQWLQARSRLKLTRSAPLLCTLHGGQMDSSYVRHLMKRLATKAGIDKRVHYHQLRHVFACDLVREGAPLTTVQTLLGHSSAATTSVYLSRMGASEAVDFARSRHWG